MFSKPKKKHKKETMERRPVNDIQCSTNNEAVQKYLQSNENTNKLKKSKHKKHAGKHKKKHKHKHTKIEEKPQQELAAIKENPGEPQTQNLMWWNGGPLLPSIYNFGSAELNFNLNCSAPMQVPQPVRPVKTFVIPELLSARPNNTSTAGEALMESKSPTKVADWFQDLSFRPISPIKECALDYLPTSEDIWLSFEASKQGAEPAWPICCYPNKQSQMKENVASCKQLPAKSIQPYKRPELDQVIACLVDSGKSSERKVEPEPQAMSSNISYVELDSMDLSLDEERGLLDFLKSKRLHTPLSDIKAFETLLSMARSEENRKSLRELLRPKRLVQLKSAKGLPKAPLKDTRNMPAKQLEATVMDTKQQRTAATVERPEVAPIVVVNNEVLQQAIDSLSIDQSQQQQQQQKLQQLQQQQQQQQQMQKQQLENKANQLFIQKEPTQMANVIVEQPLVKSAEKVPPAVVTSKPQEDAVQLWLQQLSQDLSRVVQSRLDSMPTAAQQRQPSALPMQPIDFEVQISQSAQLMPRPKPQLGDALSGESASVQDFSQGTSPWECSYKRRLDGFDNVIDHNMSEFRDPQGKRLRSRWINETSKKNLDSLKRDVLMPPLPSHLGHGLQQLRILRPPTKRKVERTKLQVEMKLVRTYSTMHAKCTLDMNKLALEMDNTVYNSDIQVLQKRYEAAQVAWIWPNGSILISNARSKAILTETQNTLLARILGSAQTASQPLDNALHSQMIHIAQLPWHICIEEFSQTYALSTETVQGSFRYAYYVNKNLPGVAAKVYESGAIQVLAMTTSQADSMLEKLFLLTANHRKPKTAILSKTKLDCTGKFIPLYPI